MSFRRRQERRHAHRSVRSRLQVEPLESRILLAQVTADTSQVLGMISPELTGTNLLYGYQPDAAWADGRVAAKLNEINTGFLRYPGGEFTSTWHWRDQIGQVGVDTWNPKRQVDPVPGEERMNFDEYIQQVRLAGAKPLVGINMESGYRYGRVQDGVEEAVALVQYAQDRGYNIEHYFLDNESQGVMSAKQYADFVNLYANAMRRVDPTIKLVVNWDNRWNEAWATILDTAGANIDYVDLHTYWNSGNATFDQWQGDQLMLQQGDTYVAKIQEFKSEIASRGLSAKVAIFEWNLGPADSVASRPSEFEAGLMNAEIYMQFIWAGLDAAALWPLNSTAATASAGVAERSLLTAGDLNATPICSMLSLYASALGQQQVVSNSSGPEIRSAAAFDSATQSATIYLLQKTGEATEVQLDLGSYFDQPGNFYFEAETFQAPGGAVSANVAEIASVAVTRNSDSTLQLTAAPFSLTKVTVSRTPSVPRAAGAADSGSDSSPGTPTVFIAPLPGAGPTNSGPALSDDSSTSSLAIQSLLVDINSRFNGGHSDPTNFLRIGEITFFTAITSATYSELWITDGTTAGTVRIKDISPGAVTSAPQDFTEVNGTLFFTANDGNSGVELWKSNGTTAGTLRVADMRPGPGSSNATSLVNVGGTLYFTANDGSSGCELWKSDGTAAGTVQVSDIAAGAAGSQPTSLINVGGTLYFQAAKDGRQLWKSDGTPSGTLPVVSGSPGPRSPQALTNVGGTLFFRAANDDHGYELWKSDGTSVGTFLVADILPGSGGSGPQLLTNVAGTLYFRANDGLHGDEVWRTDGTSAGTVLVADILPGAKSSRPRDLTSSNVAMFFLADDGVNGLELWKADEAGAFRLTSFAGDPNSTPLGGLVDVEGTLYFWGDDGISGNELWKSDGTQAGTAMAADTSPGATSGSPINLTKSGGALYFSAIKSGKGRELFSLDSAGRAVTIKDISSGTNSGGAVFLTNVKGTLYFRTNDGYTGYELWKSDGTAGGTVRVKDIAPGTPSSNVQSLINVNCTLYFVADTSNSGFELWKSDGTAAGTVQVKDIRAGALGSYPSHLTNVNGRLFFGATNGVGGFELWTSNGTASGTTRLKEIRAGAAGSYPSNLLNVNGTLYFQANDGIGGSELWKSNGTTAGTTLVKDIRSGGFSSYPRWLTNVTGTLYFQANDGVGGTELWKSNGTAATTVRTRDIRPGSEGSYPQGLTAVGDLLFFRAQDDDGYELWKADVAAGGVTVRVADLLPGEQSSHPRQLTNVDGTLYFSANNGVDGYELWKSNGTVASTVAVKDLRPGGFSSYLSGFINANGVLCFQANDGTGATVWLSDGTAAGTLPVDNLNDNSPIQPLHFTSVGPLILYAGGNDRFGAELWRVNRRPVAARAVLAVEQNTTTRVSLRGDDADEDSLNYQIISPPQHGSLSGISLNGTAQNVIYIPDPDYLGSDSFSFQVSDGTLISSLAVVALTVVAVNHPPIASDETLTLAEDTSRGLVLRASDEDLDGQTLNYVIIAPPTHGVLTGSGANRRYTPDANYEGADSFSFRASDGAANSNPATVTINVTAINDAPLLNTDSRTQFGTLLEDAKAPGGTLLKYLSNRITDVDPTSVKGIGVTSAPTVHGEWQFSLDGAHWQPLGEVSDSAARLLPLDNTARVRFLPALHFNGEVTFDYRAWDQTTGTAGDTLDTAGQTSPRGTFSVTTAAAVFTITPVNDWPAASNATLTTEEDTVATGTLVASDVEGDAFTYSIVSQARHGRVSIDAVTGVYEYTPFANFNGNDSFSFQASDSTGSGNTAAIKIAVTPINDPPVANSSALSIDEDNAATGMLGVSDVDRDALTFSIVTGGQHGTVTITNAATGAYRYIPNANYYGLDSFSFKVGDGTLRSNSATVAIWIKPVNDAPLASDGILAAKEDIASTGKLPANDVEGHSLTYTIVSNGEHGTATITNAATGAYKYIPHANYNGPDSFTFEVRDAAAHSNTATVGIQVTSVNDAPVLDPTASARFATLLEDMKAPRGTLVKYLSNKITDIDGESVKGIGVTGAPTTNGAWQFSLDGTSWRDMGAVSDSAARLLPLDDTTRVRFIPNHNFNGRVGFRYRAWDQTTVTAGSTLPKSGHTGGSGTFSTAMSTAVFTIAPVNDAPKLQLGGTIGYVHDSRAIPLAPNAEVSDVDSIAFYRGRLRVWVSEGNQSSNRLTIGNGFTIDSNSNVRHGTTIIGRRTANGVGTNELVIWFDRRNATSEIVQLLVRSLAFSTQAGVTGTRKVSFMVTDGAGGVSREAIKTVNVT